MTAARRASSRARVTPARVTPAATLPDSSEGSAARTARDARDHDAPVGRYSAAEWGTEWILVSDEWSRTYRGSRLAVRETPTPATLATRATTWTAYVAGVAIPGRWPSLRYAKRRAERAAVRRAEQRRACVVCERPRDLDPGQVICTGCALDGAS